MLERLLGNEIRLETCAPSDLPPIYGDPGQIEQAIINLAVNARDAMPDGGVLTLAARLTRVDEAFARAHLPMPQGEYVELEVTDTGLGMPPEIQAHIFEPFFTTKGVGKGTGLGLSMVYGTVKQSGGFIFASSEVGKGTTFRLYFPPVRDERQRPTSVARLENGAATILVAEDEPAVRSLVVSALKADGYRVLQASGGTEALQLAATAGGPIHLLLTDATMPGMNGIELARTLAHDRPDLKVLIMSGYTTSAVEIDGLSAPPATLPKPFTPRDLRQKVREVLGT
jgi:CheY-like chemotaxis protein